MTYQELQQALKVLGLPERASLKEIKARHRSLVKRHHPDSNPDQATDRIREINAAYRLLMDFCAGYRFCFSQEEFYEQNPEERLRQQFSQDPVWGG
jgi:hypothetical protein